MPASAPEPSDWTTVAVRVAAAEAEVAADQLWAHGPAAVEELDDDAGLLLRAGYPTVAQAEAAAADQRRHGRTAAVAAVTDDGLDGWRAHARVERAGPFVIHPTWVPVPPVADDELLLDIDPGPTFGSGSHPTSRLCLAALAQLVRPGSTVIDVGCGSGILAVGAALVGAGTVVGIDLDPASPEVTAANAARNGVEAIVRASCTDLSTVVAEVGPAPLVLANLLAPVIVELADALVRATAPGGLLVVSGLLADRWAPTVAVLGDREEGAMVVVDHAELDGWVAVTLASAPGDGSLR